MQMNVKKSESNVEMTTEDISKSLFMKWVIFVKIYHISHPQVTSYLVGGGDHYTTHKFTPLYWVNIERLVLGSLSEVPPAIPISAPSSSDIHDEIDGGRARSGIW
jgi:hypothetical protein